MGETKHTVYFIYVEFRLQHNKMWNKSRCMNTVWRHSKCYKELGQVSNFIIVRIFILWTCSASRGRSGISIAYTSFHVCRCCVSEKEQKMSNLLSVHMYLPWLYSSTSIYSRLLLPCHSIDTYVTTKEKKELYFDACFFVEFKKSNNWIQLKCLQMRRAEMKATSENEHGDYHDIVLNLANNVKYG